MNEETPPTSIFQFQVKSNIPKFAPESNSQRTVQGKTSSPTEFPAPSSYFLFFSFFFNILFHTASIANHLDSAQPSAMKLFICLFFVHPNNKPNINALNIWLHTQKK